MTKLGDEPLTEQDADALLTSLASLETPNGMLNVAGTLYYVRFCFAFQWKQAHVKYVKSCIGLPMILLMANLFLLNIPNNVSNYVWKMNVFVSELAKLFMGWRNQDWAVFIRDLSLIGLTGTPLKTKQWILTNVKMVLLEERWQKVCRTVVPSRDITST